MTLQQRMAEWTLQRSGDSHQGGEESKWQLDLAGRTTVIFPVTSICSSTTQPHTQFDERLQFCCKRHSMKKDRQQIRLETDVIKLATRAPSTWDSSPPRSVNNTHFNNFGTANHMNNGRRTEEALRSSGGSETRSNYQSTVPAVW